MYVISKAKFFHTACDGIVAASSWKHLGDEDSLYERLTPKSQVIVFLHVDDDVKKVHQRCSELLNFAPLLKIAVFRNAPSHLEGCSLLKVGIKSYAHALSHHDVLKQIHQTISQKNVWVYPELMQFMIAEVSTKHEHHQAPLARLSNKEKEIALMVTDGMSNAKIASVLSLAEITVKKHLSSIYEKLAVKDRLALALLLKH